MPSLELLLGIAAGVVLVGVVAVRVSVRLGLPSLLLYLGIGMVLGESVLGIQFNDAALTESLGLAALVLILAEGGLTTSWRAVRPSLGLGVALSTVSVLVSIGVVGAALHLLLHLEWRTALLWGAVLSSTDAAAVFSVLRGVGVSRRLSGALELESGMNDAPVVLAVLLLSSSEPFTWLTPVLVVYELVAGGADRGAARARRRVGAAPRRAALHRPLPAGRDRRLPARLHRGPVHARLRAPRDLRRRARPRQLRPAPPRRRALVRRGHRLAGPDRPVRAARAVRLAAPAGERRHPGPGRGRGAAAGRPAALRGRGGRSPSGCPWREQAFLSWSGLRGAVPIVLALIALTEGAPDAHRPASTSCSCWSSCCTLLQGTTLPWVARLLGVARAGEPREIEVDAAPLDELGADLLQVRVPVGSRLQGVYLQELRLPRGAVVEPRRARRQGLHPDPGDPAAGTRPAARRHHLARAGGGRGADPRRRHARSPGEVVGSPGSRTGMMDGVSDQPDAAPDRRVSHREPRAAARCHRGRGAGGRHHHQDHRGRAGWRDGSPSASSAASSTCSCCATPVPRSRWPPASPGSSR